MLFRSKTQKHLKEFELKRAWQCHGINIRGDHISILQQGTENVIKDHQQPFNNHSNITSESPGMECF